MKFIKPSRYNHAKPITSRALRLMPHKNVDYLDIVGLANCANPESVFNTGIPLCDLKRKKIKGVILADAGVSFSGADIASTAAFIQAVKDKTTAARGGRVYPIWDINNFTDNTGDPSTGSVGNLSTATIVTSDAVPTFQFGYNGSEARHKKMSAMNGASLTVFFVDSQYAVYGTEDGNGGIKGFDVLQAYTNTAKFIVADAVDQYAFRLTLGDISQYRELSQFVVTNSGLLSAVGLINVYMTELSKAANVVKVKVVEEGGTDLEPLYGADIAGLTFTAVNLQTGASFTVTSVADDTSLDALTITLDSTAWTALASGDKIQINPPSADDLAAAGVKPYEFFALIVEKP